MTYRAWWAARWLLWEEQFGTLIRAAEHEREAEENRLAAQYRQTVAALKARGSPDGPG